MNNPGQPCDASFDLNRFVEAQSGSYERALSELKRGRKQNHWMWFVFPQFRGLGQSHTSQFYSIGSIEEAQAYLAHPVLGPRLLECSEVLADSHQSSASDIFGFPDDLKLRSSMTLFSQVAERHSVFTRVLEKYFDGEPDTRTLEFVVESAAKPRSRT